MVFVCDEFLERNRGVSRAIYLGKVSVACLLTTMETLVQGEESTEFIKSLFGWE